MVNKVVCISDQWKLTFDGGYGSPPVHPAKGEIYTVIHVYTAPEGREFYVLKEIGKAGYATNCFRPTDDTFGPNICEIISKQIEVEEMEKISV